MPKEYYVIIEPDTGELYSGYLYSTEFSASYEISVAQIDRTNKKLEVVKVKLCKLDYV